MTEADVVVVGAGIVGASCAHFLAEARLRVCIVERGGVAGGTSGSGEGNILLSDKVPGPELAMARVGLALWAQLAHVLPDDIEYEEKGAIVVAEDAAQLEALRATVAAVTAEGVEARLLDASDLQAAEPYLARDLAGAAYYPRDAQVQPMLAAAALVRSARRNGAILLDHAEVQAVERDCEGAIAGVRTSRGRVRTPRLVNAAGPWSPAVAALCGTELPIQPRKGHIVVTEPLPRLVFHKVFEAGYADTVASDEAALQVAAVVEDTRSGTILLGSSRQRAGFRPGVEVDVLRAIVRRAVRFFPILASVQVLRGYVGYRAFAPDHLPIVGADPAVPGYYVNTGHEGAGIGLGPISGKLLAQFVLGRPTDIDMTPFRPDRFERPSAREAQVAAGS
jgi:glycine/D-amino acid oxidase-like deaminating enzyme